MHHRDPPEAVRVEIVLDVWDANPDLLFIRAAARAVKLVEELRRDSFHADIVSVNTDSRRHHRW